MHLRNLKIKRVSCLSYSTEKLDKTLETLRYTTQNKFRTFFNENEHLKETAAHIPSKYLQITRKATIDNLYLVCPRAAKAIADLIMPHLNLDIDQIIAESNPGLGLISQELLRMGVKRVRFYESCSEFRKELKEIANNYPNRIELYTRNLFHIYRYEFMDKQNNGRVAESLMNNVPIHSWGEDPVMTIIGTVTVPSFYKHLIKTIGLQTGITAHGRIDSFVLMKPLDYSLFSSTVKDNLKSYQNWTILFNIFYEHLLMEKFPKELFLPWQIAKKKNIQYSNYEDPDKMYLVKIKFKEQLPVPVDQLLHLFYFIKNIYATGSGRIIPTIEKWIPNSGINVLVPKLEHDDYFKNMDIFTQFRELTPAQVLSLYKEIVNTEGFSESPFFALIENELLRSQTIETCVADANLEKTIIGDIEEKMGS